jgi:CDP-diacylglycerol--glycerol-3-phosphate 3-phosphatidyltransferase
MNNQVQKTARILPKKLRSFTSDHLNSIASLFINLNINPNTLSIFAAIAGLGAGVLFVFEKPLWAGILIIICGILDILDGKVAVGTNKTSTFGAIFDSTLDRYSEFFIYLGLAVHFRDHWALWVTFFTFLGSTMVSYTRARAEGLGIECKIGVMQRAERMVFLATGSIIGFFFNIFNPLMIGALVIIALLSNITAIQRTLYVKKVEKQKKSESQI